MNPAIFIGTWWSLVPPLLAICLALITKEVYSSLILGIVAGVLMYTGFNPWQAFIAFYDIMKDSMNLNILIFDIMLGVVIVLMVESGGSRAYGEWAAKKVKTKKKALLATMGLGILIFVDDYFNCLTVGSVMRPVTSRYKVSKTKLAYIIDATAAPICIIAPMSSWAAAVNSYVPEDVNITGFQLFLRTIPYNLYALLTLVMVLYIILTGFDFGKMKKFEDKTQQADCEFDEIDKIEQEEGSKSKGKIMDLILPVVVLIALTVGTMIYTGFLGGAKNVVSAFANCDAEVSLVFASTVTLIFMLILYIPRRIMTFQKFMESLAEGFKLMIPSILILVFAWSLKGVGDALQISTFVENTLGGSVTNGAIIPMVMFMIAIFLAFSTGSSWGTFAILIPIVTAIFSGGGNMEMMVISISAVLAGAVCGDHVSPISDTTIMSSAGAQCHHIDHVSTQMQYAIVVAVVCEFGYLIAGFVQVWWIVLLISIAVLLTTLTIMKKYVNKKYLKK